MRELAKKRKERETNFEEKRMNLSVQVLDDEKIVTEKKSAPPPAEEPVTDGAKSMHPPVDSRENKENIDNSRLNVPPHHEPAAPPYEQVEKPPPMKNDPYYDDPKAHRDPYYDQGYDILYRNGLSQCFTQADKQIEKNSERYEL